MCYHKTNVKGQLVGGLQAIYTLCNGVIKNSGKESDSNMTSA